MGKLAAEGTTNVASAAPAIDFIADHSRHRSITSVGTEIRVHGVGDHATFSALGQPGYENRRRSQVVICEPPQLPAHRLLLIAWSRANRRLTRTLLVPAFPVHVDQRRRVYDPTAPISGARASGERLDRERHPDGLSRSVGNGHPSKPSGSR